MPEYRYSYANTLVYEEDGQILGILVSFPEEKEAHIDDALAPLFPKIGLPETTRFFNDKEAQPGERHIDTIAVVPQARGKGVGSKLLAACESVAKANHKQIISLNVDFNNPGAKNYTKKWVIKSLGN